MMPYRRALTSQPQYVVGVDAKFPEKPFVKAAFTNSFDAATKTPVKNNGLPSVAGNSGLSIAFDGANYAEFSKVPYVAPPFTIFFVANKSSAAMDSLISFGGAGAGGGWQIQTAGISSDGRITYGGVADYANISGFYSIGVDALYAVSVNGSTARFFRNGVFINSCAVGTANTATKPLTLGACYNSSYTNFSTSRIYGGILLSVALSDATVSSMQAKRSVPVDGSHVPPATSPVG